MNSKEIDRYEIGLVMNANSVDIFLISAKSGVRATANVHNKSRRLNFMAAASSNLPANYTTLDDTVSLGAYFNRGICAGQTPDVIILNAAYMFVQTNDAPEYDEPAIETDDYEIVLNAASDVAMPRSDDSGVAPKSSKKGGPRTPKRRKTQINVWI